MKNEKPQTLRSYLDSYQKLRRCQSHQPKLPSQGPIILYSNSDLTILINEKLHYLKKWISSTDLYTAHAEALQCFHELAQFVRDALRNLRALENFDGNCKGRIQNQIRTRKNSCTSLAREIMACRKIMGVKSTQDIINELNEKLNAGKTLNRQSTVHNKIQQAPTLISTQNRPQNLPPAQTPIPSPILKKQHSNTESSHPASSSLSPYQQARHPRSQSSGQYEYQQPLKLYQFERQQKYKHQHLCPSQSQSQYQTNHSSAKHFGHFDHRKGHQYGFEYPSFSGNLLASRNSVPSIRIKTQY